MRKNSKETNKAIKEAESALRWVMIALIFAALVFGFNVTILVMNYYDSTEEIVEIVEE